MKTAPIKVELIDFMGSDLSVVNAARVSFHKESDWEYINPSAVDEFYKPIPAKSDKVLSEKDQKLISYLAKHNHWSPFAHTSLQFRIKAPIFVARQLGKHQVGGVWNEVSRRYVDDEPVFYFPDVWRGRSESAKQGSEGVLEKQKEWTDLAMFATEENLKDYLLAIKEGMAPEQARMLLPQNTMTEWIWTGSLAFFARVVNLRMDPHAQKECKDVAILINNSIPKDFEHSWKTLTTS